MDKKELTKNIWSRKAYYEKAEEGSLDISHPAMKKLIEEVKNAESILDMGCGEGTRLNKLISKNQKGYGIDISRKAIQIAKKKYPRLNFTVGDLEKLPYKNNIFDLVYSAYVFEHLDYPEKVINEAIRVLTTGGELIIIAPNYGAPNRASPPFSGNRIMKIINGFLYDFSSSSELNWNKVKPIATAVKYDIDWDTTIEPYLGSLIKFLKHSGLKIKYYSSNWDKDSLKANIFQKTFKFLGKIGIFPFSLWGPHLIVIAQKI